MPPTRHLPPTPLGALACLLAALLLALAAAPALADWRHNGDGFVALVADNGRPVHWEARLVLVEVSLKGAPPGALEAARCAFAAWEEALLKECGVECGVPLRFLVEPTEREGSLDHRDGTNFVFWGQCDDIARTRTYSDQRDPAAITGFDMVLNRNKPWGLAPDGRVGYDPQSVITHEVGHVLGLADIRPEDARRSDVRPGDVRPGEIPGDVPGDVPGDARPAEGAAVAANCPRQEGALSGLTMFGWATCGETLKRQLKAGDRRGVAFLYAGGARGGGGKPSLAGARLDSTAAAP